VTVPGVGPDPGTAAGLGADADAAAGGVDAATGGADAAAVGVDAAAAAVRLAGALRTAGVRVGTGQVVTCRRALEAVDPGDPEDRYWAGRVTLLTDRRDVAAYDAVFAAWQAGRLDDSAAGTTAGPADEPPPLTSDAASDRPGGDDPSDAPLVAGAVTSERERLRRRRFDRASDEELAAITDALRRLEVAVPHRVSRRTTPGRRGVELDLAGTLERAMATDGEALELVHRARRTRPRRLVVLLDVSGSMAAYARALLRFAVVARHSAAREAGRQVEVFAFGTRLTRLTGPLAARDPDAALRAAAEEVVDWDGGTRIGASIAELNRVWGRRGVLRGAVVVICSDGLERGDPAELATAMARLRRHAHRVVWVNPLAGDPRFEPTQRGMRAALDHLDVFLPGHDLASLETLSGVLADLR
jgi:uncharacterized protein